MSTFARSVLALFGLFPLWVACVLWITPDTATTAPGEMPFVFLLVVMGLGSIAIAVKPSNKLGISVVAVAFMAWVHLSFYL